ncbi:hypothetical protein [Rathayibacter toxicus]|uniref:Uncharacterized protein n=2 Tax=Rathayibacter toxicus TaxID=145458 RepID=A0A0U1PQN8_9MICO|nr:hypothetical protein [Rathayibacter toxicus]KKM44257.1 hypothetical protein VT73_10095 [Rathayibacter toxicus]PPG45371.1 hypothetical protein C5D16_06935 [Rathayibacter toxicus]PPH22474.1 hypothetical protein C5D17_06980 [Rathayibacter toxicus]PPH59368.1 hypothetical protein C5C93_07010 [Rathayibacter toxicus]PPH62818.1 hypothetical protein C5D13_07030 [Rathayibacter toxicus]
MEPISGEIVYVAKDYAFDYRNRPADVYPGAMTVFDTLVVELGEETGRLQYLDGFAPREDWIPRKLAMPELVDRAVHVAWTAPSGDAYRARCMGVTEDEFEMQYDKDANILRFAQPGVPESKVAAQFCNGAAIGIDDGKVVDLWIIHPKFEEKE